MKSWCRILCLLIALLVAGKEVVAFGHASPLSLSLSMNEHAGESAADWVIECEVAPECEGESDATVVATDAIADGHCSCQYRLQSTVHARLNRQRIFKLAVSEFYIYVLNLRL